MILKGSQRGGADAWEHSDDGRSFRTALRDRGYFLARGDRRGVVALDVHGEVFAIPRRTGLRAREVRARIADTEALRSVDETREHVKGLVSDKLRRFPNDAERGYQVARRPLVEERVVMVSRHLVERETLRRRQAEQWNEERQRRTNRFRKGLRGLWDRLTGTTAAIRKRNERETRDHLDRDRVERDGLVTAQMGERRTLQDRIVHLRRDGGGIRPQRQGQRAPRFAPGAANLAPRGAVGTRRDLPTPERDKADGPQSLKRTFQSIVRGHDKDRGIDR